MKLINFIYRNTLRSVIFGIAMMVAIGLYIAVGSGLARVREHFEMNELQFFSAWPLKLLMVLLVANLSVVTWTRIPFTPPRYGVWCVHAGIITLIAGMALYYNRKVEGMTRIFVDAREGPNVVDHFYDAAERSLYVKVNDELASWHPLDALPRFKEYENVDQQKLKGIEPYLLIREGSSEPKQRKISDVLGLKDPVKVDITGYWPYANIITEYREDPSDNTTGLRLSLSEKNHTSEAFEDWLVSSDPRRAMSMLGEVELEHRHASAAATEVYKDAAAKLYRLSIRRGEYSETLDVQIGKSYSLGATGYSINIEDYKPSWPMFGTNEMVRALTLHVKTPTQEFRRMVLEGKDVQTDFALNAEGAGPMGKRQKEPLDKELVIQFMLNDPYHLSPQRGTVKHTLITSDAPGVSDVAVNTSAAVEVREAPSGATEILIGKTGVSVQRMDHLRRVDRVQVVPSAKRTRDAGEAGVFQVVRAKISVGGWSREMLVPFAEETADTRRWDGETISLPGTTATIGLQLGKTRLSLPAKLTLKEFKLVPYAGGDESRRSIMRDFRSTVIVEDPRSGEKFTEVAHMNSPIYFDSGRWLFFQAAFDGENARWTVLGVGNRPGVWIMITGFAMIFCGVGYAFYIKPIVIRKMKANAIVAANSRRTPSAIKVEPGMMEVSRTG